MTDITLCKDLSAIINNYKMCLWEVTIYVEDEDIDSCVISFKPTDDQLDGLETYQSGTHCIVNRLEYDAQGHKVTDPAQYKAANVVIDTFDELELYIDQAYEDIDSNDIVGYYGIEDDCDFDDFDDLSGAEYNLLYN